MSTPEFTPRDDSFHFAEIGDRWWATETSWFSFYNVERRLGGWLYTLVRPNIGTVQGGLWIWDDSAALPWEVPYSANYSALRFPRDQDLTDIALPTGVSIRRIAPGMSYDLGYRDGDRVALDLRFDGVMPPRPLQGVDSGFGINSHYDQFGRVHGEIVLHGERIAIDCLAMRDRSWGPRPEHRPRPTAYVTGIVDEGNGFFQISNPSLPGDPASYGFLMRDGKTVTLARGNRTVERDPATGYVSAIRVEGADRDGRAYRIEGRPLSRIVLNRHTFIDINSLIEWTFEDGRTGWGEDQDMWSMHDFSRWRRTGKAR